MDLKNIICSIFNKKTFVSLRNKITDISDELESHSELLNNKVSSYNVVMRYDNELLNHNELMVEALKVFDLNKIAFLISLDNS